MFFDNLSNQKDTKLYDTLGVSKSASESEIKKAYKKLALKFHPDRNKTAEAEDKFKEIAAAYDVLGDSEKRSTYDKFGLEAVKSGGGPGGFGMGGNPFDVFESMFGGASSSSFKRSNVKRKGKSMVKEIGIDLADIYNENNLSVALTNLSKCDTCEGLGCQSSSDIIICSRCDGSGVLVQIQQFGPGMISQSQQTCPTCHGRGKKINPNKLCLKCGGKKVIKKKQLIKLNLNKTHKTGDKIVFNELADYNPDVDIQGDLVLVIKTNPSKFKRIENNLYIDKTISLIDALCGANLKIVHLDGRVLCVNTLDVLQPNSIYKISNEGMNHNSNLFIKFNIIFPKKLSDERKMYIKKLINNNQVIDDSTQLNSNTNENYKFLDELSETETDYINSKVNILNSRKDDYSKYNNNNNEEEYEEASPINCATQ